MTPAGEGHILIVVSDDITRKLIVGILNNKGYETFEARTGDEAILFLPKNLQLIILDLENDDLDHLGLIRKLQMSQSRVPMIALTEETDHDAVQAQLDIPKVSVMQKPLMPEKLLRSIEGYLIPGVESKILKAVQEEARQPMSFHAHIDSKNMEDREQFMRRAVDLSQEKMDENAGGPFGAVIVKNGVIVAEGWNCVTSTNDPTAHAEMVAIRRACDKLGTFSLEGCEIHTSCEPCPMCLAALYWARIDRIFYGNTREDAARIGFDDEYIYREIPLDENKRGLPCKMFLRDEAKIVFENWMKKQDKTPY